MMAALNGHANIVELLIEKGSNIDAQDDDEKTALMYAAEGARKNGTRALKKTD